MENKYKKLPIWNKFYYDEFLQRSKEGGIKKMTEQINEIKQKRNIWKIISLITIAIIVLAGLYFGYSYFANKFYSSGYSIGLQQGQLSVIQSIGRTGNIPFLENSTGNWTVQTIPISKLCSNMQGIK